MLLISRLAVVSCFVPVLFFIFHFKVKALKLSHWTTWVGFTILNALIFDLIGAAFFVFKWGNNSLLFLHLYTIAETTLLAFLFHYFFRSKTLRFWIFGFLILILSIETFQLTREGYLFQMNPITRSLESLFVVFFSLLYFYRMLSEMKVQDISRDLMFWVSTAFLMYFGGNFILFLLSDQLIRNTPAITGIQVFVLHSILQLTLNTLLSIGIWRSSR